MERKLDRQKIYTGGIVCVSVPLNESDVAQADKNSRINGRSISRKEAENMPRLPEDLLSVNSR